jgi:hypothetical protein
VLIGVVALLLLCGGFVWLAQLVDAAREAARQTACRGRMSQLSMALYNYHDVYGSFPPATVADANGRPMHSWRVLLLPFLEQKRVYDEYDFSEPWDGPHNRTLAGRINLDAFHCHSGSHGSNSPVTDYVVVTGLETLFPVEEVASLGDISDGPENTILLVEIADSDIHWMEPRDLDLKTMSLTINDPSRASISAPHALGPAVVFADAIRAIRIRPTLRPETLRALLTRSGGESISRDSVLQTDDDRQYLGE